MLQVNEFMRGNHVPEMSVEEIAMGFVRVANEAMCRPIRNLTQGKGYGKKIKTFSAYDFGSRPDIVHTHSEVWFS